MALRQTYAISRPDTAGIFFLASVFFSLLFVNCGSGDNPVNPVQKPANLVYHRNPANSAVRVAFTPDLATVTGNVDSFSVSPPLPAGLAINRVTGTISGTPTVSAPAANYTVSTWNSAGSASVSLAMTIDNALAIETPVGGESFSFQNTIPVRWTGNPDSIGNPPLQSFTMEFSLDTGKTWIKMSYPTESVLDNSDGIYQISWIGLDTTFLNPVTFDPLTKSDFLNKGVIIHIISYPPKNITRQSGYIFFHE
jgi:hypothetical protein